MSKSIFFAVVFFLAVYCKSHAQTFVFGHDSILLQKFDFEVKQLTQFFDRFNYEEQVVFPGGMISSRTRNIASLFNLSDSMLIGNVQTMNFLKFVCNDSNRIYLSFRDNDWYAFAHCSFLYHNKSTRVDIVLKPEGSNAEGFRWAIVGVRCNLFPFFRRREGTGAFINPMNHELDFSELSKALKRKLDISSYCTADYQIDALSAFLAMVQNGDLKFIQINYTDFEFLQLPGWAFTVRNFNRANYNSGWLISSLTKMSKTQKKNYIANHFMN